MSSPSARPGKPPGWPSDIILGAGVGGAVAFVSSVSFLVINDMLPLCASSLATIITFGDKLEVVAKYSLPGAVWLLFCVFWTASRRVKTGVLNPMTGQDGDTSSIMFAKNVFQNSLEQYIISVALQAGIVSYLSPAQVLKIIPLMNFFHVTGRIAFAVGYPNYRTFGFFTTVLPSLAAAGYGLFKFAASHF